MMELSMETCCSILIFSENHELAGRRLGSCSQFWLSAHRWCGWRHLVLLSRFDVPRDEFPQSYRVGAHATVTQFATAESSL